MAQPSSIQVLGGPQGGQRLEFHGGDVVIGSAPDCAVRIDIPGVEPHHARIVIDVTGATIYAVDGVLGVNDDLVSGDSLLRSGDFVWLGEPAGADSLMLQFTLGEVDDAGFAPEMAAAGPVETMAAEEAVSEDLAAPDALEEVPEPLVMEEAESEPLTMSAPETEGLAMQPDSLEEAPETETPGVGAPESEAAAPLQEEPGETVAEAPLEVEEPLLAAEEPEPLVAETPEAAPVEALVEAPDEEPLVEETVEEVIAPAELEPVSEPEPLLSPTEDPVAAESASSPAVEAPKVVPPAPWATSGSATPEPKTQAEYASAWESPAAPVPAEPTPVEPAEETIVTKAPASAPPPPPPAPPPPAAPRPPRHVGGPRPGTVPPAPRRPGSTPAQRIKADSSPRMPKAAPATSNAPMIVGGLAALLIVAGGGYWLTRPAAPVVLAPTPRPTPVAVSTPPPATPELAAPGAETAVVEPTPDAQVPPVPGVAPTPQVAATPAPRATPPPRATPAPAPTRAAAAPPTPAPAPAAAVAAPVSQAPRLLQEASAAVAANDLARASQLLDQVLSVEPGNREATTRKAEVAARLASLNRRFSIGTTTVLGGKTSRGPTGFDLGGGGVVQTEFSAQIRCTTTPASVEPGMNYSLRCSILNIGDKAFRIASVAVNETTDGAKAAGAGTAPRGDVAPQSDQAILERSGAWAAKSGWSIEIVAKSTKDESFRAVYTWR